MIELGTVFEGLFFQLSKMPLTLRQYKFFPEKFQINLAQIIKDIVSFKRIIGRKWKHTY